MKPLFFLAPLISLSLYASNVQRPYNVAVTIEIEPQGDERTEQLASAVQALEYPDSESELSFKEWRRFIETSLSQIFDELETREIGHRDFTIALNDPPKERD